MLHLVGARARPGRAASAGFGHQPAQAIGERFRRCRRDEQAGAAVVDHFENAADGGRDDRQSRGHRLEHAVGKGFRARWQHGDVGRGESPPGLSSTWP